MNENSSLIIDGTTKLTDNLIRISKECSRKNIKLTIKLDDDKSTDNVIRLIKASSDNITIELI